MQNILYPNTCLRDLSLYPYQAVLANQPPFLCLPAEAVQKRILQQQQLGSSTPFPQPWLITTQDELLRAEQELRPRTGDSHSGPIPPHLEMRSGAWVLCPFTHLGVRTRIPPHCQEAFRAASLPVFASSSLVTHRNIFLSENCKGE